MAELGEITFGIKLIRCSECDRVEVVRCKDCKNKFFNEDLEMNCCLVWGDGYEVVQDDGFCSYGERKTDETD